MCPTRSRLPLAVIQNNAELLQNEASDRGTAPGLHRATILQATKRLSSLITNMLKLNKLEKQVIQPLPEAYDLCAPALRCARCSLRTCGRKSSIEFEADLEDRAAGPRRRGADGAGVDQPAVQRPQVHAGGRPGYPDANLRRRTESTVCRIGHRLRHGRRTPCAKIFEKFYQGDTSHATEGNGLGLALVQRILELSDGTISVISAPEQGSAFTVRLPRALSREEVQQ